MAFVTGNSVDTEALIALAKAQLPAYMVPRQVYTLSEMPLNANGKIDRRALQERLRATAREIEIAVGDRVGTDVPLSHGWAVLRVWLATLVSGEPQPLEHASLR